MNLKALFIIFTTDISERIEFTSKENINVIENLSMRINGCYKQAEKKTMILTMTKKRVFNLIGVSRNELLLYSKKT